MVFVCCLQLILHTYGKCLCICVCACAFSSVWVPEPQHIDLFTSAPCKCVHKTAWLVFVCLVFSSFCRNSSNEHAAGKCRWPLPHSHKTPYRSNFLRFCGSCFDYVSQCSRFHASSMVVKTWLLWTLLALIEFQLNDNKFKRTLHQYPFHSKSNMSRVTSSRVHFILFHFILP